MTILQGHHDAYKTTKKANSYFCRLRPTKKRPKLPTAIDILRKSESILIIEFWIWLLIICKVTSILIDEREQKWKPHFWAKFACKVSIQHRAWAKCMPLELIELKRKLKLKKIVEEICVCQSWPRKKLGFMENGNSKAFFFQSSASATEKKGKSALRKYRIYVISLQVEAQN